MRYSEEEDNLLVSLWSEEPPPRIKDIASSFPTRSERSLRKRISRLIADRRISPRNIPPYPPVSGIPDFARPALWRASKQTRTPYRDLATVLLGQTLHCAFTGAAFTERLPPVLINLPDPGTYCFVIPPVAKLWHANTPPVSARLINSIVLNFSARNGGIL